MKRKVVSLILVTLLAMFCLVGCNTKQASVVVPSINVDSYIRFSVGGV